MLLRRLRRPWMSRAWERMPCFQKNLDGARVTKHTAFTFSRTHTTHPPRPSTRDNGPEHLQ